MKALWCAEVDLVNTFGRAVASRSAALHRIACIPAVKLQNLLESLTRRFKVIVTEKEKKPGMGCFTDRWSTNFCLYSVYKHNSIFKSRLKLYFTIKAPCPRDDLSTKDYVFK